ncbi:MAG TPA: phage N-6-adenine-methyltransferase [Candidatus Mailhella merdigallinarum]|uniref:Phage N-6-adenine-methyltransferase n=1 Tax=Candidatus Mailhella merdigallinarum TaxID=2838658 RepID=A0A9D2HDE5_9BACT|nr:phage N-6-adenine-methyltransferase [Candidatus Mailhella merdigallinarum]
MPVPTKKFWRVPPDLYKVLDSEFHFDFDPCPYPCPEGYNSLVLPWGKSNFVNPPFKRIDAPYGGPSAFARKAIEEHDKGKVSVLILPVPNSIGLLLEAGAEVRYGGAVRWLEVDSLEPAPQAWRQGLFILQ